LEKSGTEERRVRADWEFVRKTFLKIVLMLRLTLLRQFLFLTLVAN